jgi:ABC-type transport system substrate-binding protein
VDLAYFGAQSAGKFRSPAFFKADFGELQKVEILEGNRLRLTLDRPAPFILSIIGDHRYGIAHPKHLMQPRIERGEVTVAPQDIGWVATGPFKLVKYEKGSRVQVQRSDTYWERDQSGKPLPYLDSIDFAIIRDPAAMDAAFRVGRLDGGARGSGHVLSKERQAGYIRDLGRAVWFAEIGGTRGGFAFNVLRAGPWQNAQVRKAISLWMDRQDAIPATMGDFGYEFTIMHPKNPFTSPDFMSWPGWNPATRSADKAEAKRLLAQAGYPQGFQMNHACRRIWVNFCEFFNAQLAGLGIDLKLVLLDDAAYAGAKESPNYDSDMGDSSYSTFPEATERQVTQYSISPIACCKHEDPRVPEFFQRLSRAKSSDERVKIWRELERYYLVEQVYYIPLFGEVVVIPYRSHVKGVIVPPENPQADMDFATVWLDK